MGSGTHKMYPFCPPFFKLYPKWPLLVCPHVCDSDSARATTPSSFSPCGAPLPPSSWLTTSPLAGGRENKNFAGDELWGICPLPENPKITQNGCRRAGVAPNPEFTPRTPLPEFFGFWRLAGKRPAPEYFIRLSTHAWFDLTQHSPRYIEWSVRRVVPTFKEARIDTTCARTHARAHTCKAMSRW